MNNQQIIKIMEFLSTYFTYQTATGFLALFGSLGTAWSILQSRKKIKPVLMKAGFNKDHLYIIHIQFLNQSRLSVAISDVSIKINGVPYHCLKEPCVAVSVAHRRYGQVLVKDYYTDILPLQIVGLGGTSAYLVFELPPDTDIDSSKPLILLISTNRGKAMEMKLDIPQTDG